MANSGFLSCIITERRILPLKIQGVVDIIIDVLVLFGTGQGMWYVCAFIAVFPT